MDFIFEILFELIVEGSLEAAGDKRVPMVIRVLACVFLIVIFGGIAALCIVSGITDKNWIVGAAGGVLLIIMGFTAWKLRSKAGERKRQKEDQD